jgi:hypothetical protein
VHSPFDKALLSEVEGLRRELMKDGEKIGCELSFGACQSCIENQEFSTVFLDQKFNEVKAKSGKAVSVGNHNLELVSAQKSFQ